MRVLCPMAKVEQVREGQLDHWTIGPIGPRSPMVLGVNSITSTSTKMLSFQTLRTFAHFKVESPPPVPENDRYPRFAPANNFIDVMLGKAENLAPGQTVGRTTVNFLDAAYRSAADGGKPVTVDLHCCQ